MMTDANDTTVGAKMVNLVLTVILIVIAKVAGYCWGGRGRTCMPVGLRVPATHMTQGNTLRLVGKHTVIIHKILRVVSKPTALQAKTTVCMFTWMLQINNCSYTPSKIQREQKFIFIK